MEGEVTEIFISDGNLEEYWNILAGKIRRQEEKQHCLSDSEFAAFLPAFSRIFPV